MVTAALLASCAPLILLAFNRDWFVTQEEWVDAWHYVGFFREYLNPDYSPGAYKLARLPWILTGFLVNHVLPPIPAAYLLHGFFLCTTTLALFLGLYALLRRVALAGVTATMLGFYTHAHGSGGWEYHNTAAGALYLSSFALFALPATIAGRRIALILAGAVMALAVHTNITFVNLVPALAFVHMRSVRARSSEPPPARALAIRAGWVLLGAVLATVVLGAINWMVGREFLFFAVLVKIAAQYVADPQHHQAQWHHAWSSGWELTATYLALPAAVVLAGAVYLSLHLRSWRQSDLVAVSLILQFLVATVVWTAWQTAGQTALDFDYFAYPLNLACFLALAGLLSLEWPDPCERHWLAMIAITIVTCVFWLSGPPESFVQIIRAPVSPALAVVGVALFASGLFAYMGRPGILTSILLICVFATGNRFVGARWPDYVASDQCKIQPAIYTAIIEGASWLGRLEQTYTRTRIWFDENEEVQPIAGCPVRLALMSAAMTTTASVPYVATPWPMPGIDDVPDAALRKVATDHEILAIVSNRPEHLEGWSTRLERIGLAYRELARHRVSMMASEFMIHSWEIVQKAPAGLAFGTPVFAVTDQTPRETNSYGNPKGTADVEGDMVVFRPTDARDHIAYPVVNLSALPTDVWAELTVELPPSGSNSSSCRLVLQTSGFVDLSTFPCESGKRYVKLPPDTPAVRVYLTDPKVRSFVLPRKIEMALSVSGY